MCEVDDDEEEWFTKKESKKRRMEGVISISETVEREAKNRNNESELRNPSHSFSGDTVTDSFTNKDKRDMKSRESIYEP